MRTTHHRFILLEPYCLATADGGFVTRFRGWRVRESLSASEAARILGVNPSTIHEYLLRGEFPSAFRRRGPRGYPGMWRIPRSEVLARLPRAPVEYDQPATGPDEPGNGT